MSGIYFDSEGNKFSLSNKVAMKHIMQYVQTYADEEKFQTRVNEALAAIQEHPEITVTDIKYLVTSKTCRVLLSAMIVYNFQMKTPIETKAN